MSASKEKKELDFNIINLMKCSIFDEQGNEHIVQSLWQNQPVILVFLRHFACIECRTHAKKIWIEREKYEKGVAKIIFIGNGSANFIQGFKEDLGIKDAPIFTDPSLKVFKSAGFKRNFLAAIGPKSIVQGIKMSKEGNKQGKYTKDAGDLWQLGGVIAINRDGRVLFKYVNQRLGDYPPENDLKNISDQS